MDVCEKMAELKEGWHFLNGEKVYVQKLLGFWHYQSPSKGWQPLKSKDKLVVDDSEDHERTSNKNAKGEVSS